MVHDLFIGKYSKIFQATATCRGETKTKRMKIITDEKKRVYGL
jgi:hypothetical protein